MCTCMCVRVYGKRTGTRGLVLYSVWWESVSLFSDSNNTKLPSGISAFCEQIPCHNTHGMSWTCMCYTYQYASLPSGMCGRRVARWLMWTRHPACGWILMGPYTYPRHGRVTLEHTPAGWPQWVVMTPAMPTSESGVPVCLMSPSSYLAVCIFLSYLHLTGTWWMDVFSTLIITPLCSNTPNLSNISNASFLAWQFNLVICCLSCLILFLFITFVCLAHTRACEYRQLPHAPENPIAALSVTEKRAINLTWAQAFDGNSPLIRYILEVSENSEFHITDVLYLLFLVSHFTMQYYISIMFLKLSVACSFISLSQ